MKLGFDCSEISKDICVVKLDVIHHQGAGPVVHKLRALVEKSRVVFISFHHKIVTLAQASGHPEVSGDTTNQKRAPSQHGQESMSACSPCWSCRGCPIPQGPTCRAKYVAPTTRDRTCNAAPDRALLPQQAGPGTSISDHNTIRRRIKLLRPVPVDQVNPTFRQLCAHRRVDIAIRPRDAETGLSRQ